MSDTRQISPNGEAILKKFEEFKPKPYLDSKKVPTIGFGTTLYPNGVKVTMKDAAITIDKAIEYLKYHLANEVTPHIPIGLNQNQFDAISSFVYNIGSGNWNSSTLKKILFTGTEAEIRAQFLRWNKSGGQVLQGLINRRNKEADLYFKH